MPSSRVSILAIFALAVLIRGGVGLTNLHRLDADPDAYRIISQTLAMTGVYGIGDGVGSAKPTAFRPPLYPYVLSWMVKDAQLTSFAVAVLHVLLGAVTVVLVFMTARQCVPDPPGNLLAWLAALLVTVDPILLQQSTLVMTETLATALVSAIMWWWVASCRRSATIRSVVVLGMLMALAYLCRPAFLVWAGLMTLVVLIVTDAPWSHRMIRAGVFALVVVAAMLGWTVRNQRVLGHPVWATTHGGYTLLLANNPSFYDYLRKGQFGTPWDAEHFLIAYTHRYDDDPKTEAFWTRDWASSSGSIPVESEVADDRRCYEAARATIERQPQMFVWSCIVRLGRLWSPLPHRTPGRSSLAVYAIGAYYVLFTVLMILGWWRLRTRSDTASWWPAITLMIALSAVHAVYWSNLRMRAPAIPAMAIVVAAAFLPRRMEPTKTAARG